MDFYARYAKICEREGLDPCSQAVASKIGVTRGTISIWNKKGTAPKAETVLAIADALNVSADYLLGRTDDPIDYTNPDLIADLSGAVLDAHNGDVRQALAFQRAVQDDVRKENMQNQAGDALLLTKYHRLSEVDRAKVSAYIDGLLSSDIYIQLEIKKEA